MKSALENHDEFCESLTRIVSVCSCATRKGATRTLDQLLELAFTAGWEQGLDLDNPMPRESCYTIWRRDIVR